MASATGSYVVSDLVHHVVVLFLLWHVFRYQQWWRWRFSRCTTRRAVLSLLFVMVGDLLFDPSVLFVLGIEDDTFCFWIFENASAYSVSAVLCVISVGSTMSLGVATGAS